ncbi:MAG: hypothetical protein ACRBB0_20885 [Pelagimonas sp.]|uniref:hypothetical protein n=1 Tax=Pelagimonas sp. TaxID=2073170 RepID=UPI003D6C4EF8
MTGRHLLAFQSAFRPKTAKPASTVEVAARERGYRLPLAAQTDKGRKDIPAQINRSPANPALPLKKDKPMLNRLKTEILAILRCGTKRDQARLVIAAASLIVAASGVIVAFAAVFA